MKNTRPYMDLGSIFDEIFDELNRNFNRGDCFAGAFGQQGRFDENTDYYPNYSYPPMNVYMTGDRSLIFEFALAGFDEKNISLSFQGDYMVFSAKLNGDAAEQSVPAESEENCHYFKRRLKMKDIEKQKYYVPLDKYAQEKVKAVYKNGILKVIIPPKDEPDQSDGIRIEIVKEGT